MQSSSEMPKQEGLGYELPATEAELFQLNKFTLFDEKIGLNLLGSNKSMLIEALKGYVDNLPNDVSDLQTPHDAGNWDAVQSVAHRMKGACLYVGTVK